MDSKETQTISLYRFELAFDGEYQDCGIFQGLYDVGLSSKKLSYIEHLFADLQAPDCHERCVFWFTVEGIIRFRTALQCIINAISNYGWSLLMTKTKKESCEGIVYEDPYQVALCEEVRPDKPEDYTEITSCTLDELVHEAVLATVR